MDEKQDLIFNEHPRYLWKRLAAVFVFLYPCILRNDSSHVLSHPGNPLGDNPSVFYSGCRPDAFEAVCFRGGCGPVPSVRPDYYGKFHEKETGFSLLTVIWITIHQHTP